MELADARFCERRVRTAYTKTLPGCLLISSGANGSVNSILSATRYLPVRESGMVSTRRSDFRSGELSGFVVPRRISIAKAWRGGRRETDLPGMLKVSCTPSPFWRALRLVISAGTLAEGDMGSPGAPQPPMRKNKMQQIGSTEILCARDESFAGRTLTRFGSPF